MASTLVQICQKKAKLTKKIAAWIQAAIFQQNIIVPAPLAGV